MVTASRRCSTGTRRQHPDRCLVDGERESDEAAALGNVNSSAANAVDDLEDDESGESSEESVSKAEQHTVAELDKVLTPIPRAAMHLQRVRSPDYFRTQYLSNLGIWTNRQSLENKKHEQHPREGLDNTEQRRESDRGQGLDHAAMEKEQSGKSAVPTESVTATSTSGSFRPISARKLVPPRRLSAEGQAKASSARMRSPSLTTRITQAGERSALRRGIVVTPGELREVSRGAAATGVSARQVLPGDGDAKGAAAGSDNSSASPAPVTITRRSPAGLVSPLQVSASVRGDDDNDGSTEREGTELRAGTRVAEAQQEFAQAVDGAPAAQPTSPTATATAIATAATTASLLSECVRKRMQQVMEHKEDEGSTILVAGNPAPAFAAITGGAGASEVLRDHPEMDTYTTIGNVNSVQWDKEQEDEPFNGEGGVRDNAEIKANTAPVIVAATVAIVGTGLERTARATDEPVTAAAATGVVDAEGGMPIAGLPTVAVLHDPTVESSPASQPNKTPQRTLMTGDEDPRARERAATITLATASATTVAADSETRPSRASTTGILEETGVVSVTANPWNPGSPPLPAEQPPRRDIRRDYLTNLGMRRAVVDGPGGTRTAPPMVRRSSFHLDSVDHPVEEELKDPSGKDITFEDLFKVVGSILKGGGGKIRKHNSRRTCQACERQNGLRGSPSGPRGGSSQGWRGRDGEGGNLPTPPCRHKHVEFAPLVSAVYIPVYSEYSDRVRRSYWNSAGEIREMVYRNMIEFDAEEYNWENVAEEEDMFYCEETHEFIHPIFFETEEQDAEYNGQHDQTKEEDHLEYINEGRKIPVMQRR